ncbi:MAG TPA: FKBP-type peptidyl-prolyl cis-trans isomerase [Longimicrobiaceae bacterium]|jgi:FKBP-type peptidyl-prolyl cis-trans isomerase|nr:FKBP-type peptidyl-prolyl cis-trans isomerase [Longimicrobiaceae bacterium]
MRLRSLIPLALSGLALTACLDTKNTGPQCQELPALSGTTVGDTLVIASGLKVLDTQLGTGAEVRTCQLMRVRYAGFLEDSTQFDSGTFDFVPGFHEVIRGFEQGVIGMKVGGSRRLVIPPSLGYGPRGATDNLGNVVIPPNATLIFDVHAVAADTTRTF